MEIREERISPDRAEQFINRNKSNRKLRDGIVEKYAHDMKHGKWTECTVPIAFYEDGDIADGQHRLWAIIESKTTQKFFIVKNLSREAGLNIDTGLGRSLVDNARISGADTELSNELISVARAVHEGVRTTKAMSNAQRLTLVEKYRAPALWAIHNGPRGKFMRNSAVLAAVARALMGGVEEGVLARYCLVVTKGFSEGQHESAAVSLRNYLLAGVAISSPAAWRDLFLKVQNSIHYFVRRRSLTVIRSVKEETYPLRKGKS